LSDAHRITALRNVPHLRASSSSVPFRRDDPQTAKTTLFYLGNMLAYRVLATPAVVRRCVGFCASSVFSNGVVSQRTFKTIGKDLAEAQHDDLFQQRKEHSESMEKKLNDLSTFAKGGGGEKAIQRHVQKNKKILARDRLKLLLDKDESGEVDFLELSLLAGLELYGTNVQAAGVVCGIGKIHGKRVMVVANDATVSAGASYPISVAKSLRAQEIAQENRLPCFYIVDSAGAYLPMQSEIFPDKNMGGRWFYNQAQMSSKKIAQVAIIPGSCTAGGAYMCTMSDEAVIVKDIGCVYLGGPPLVKAATGEIVTDIELGGADLHTRMSGCTDHFASNELEAFQIARDIAETLPDRASAWPGLSESRFTEGKGNGAEPLYEVEELMGIAPRADKAERVDMYKVLARILDGSELHEHRARYGSTLITGWARIDGVMVGIIANNGPIVQGTSNTFESMENVGASACPAALKGAHFIRLCEQKQIPLVFLVDTDDAEDVAYVGKDVGVAKDLALMMTAVNTTKLPSVTVIVGRNSGPGSYAMGARCSSPSFLLSWPHARSGVAGSNYDAWFGTSRVWDDGIISPLETRRVLSQLLALLTTKH